MPEGNPAETMEKSTRLSVWLPLCVMCMAQFLASADNVTLSIATGVLMRDLGATLGQVSKANTMYPLVAGTFMVAGGMLGLIVGWTRTFRLGCAIYLVAEICAVFSPSIDFFIYFARVLAGIGGSFMIPSVFGLITSTYSGRLRALAFGALGASSGVSFASAPIVCGFLLNSFGWRPAFGTMGAFAILILVCSPLIPVPAKPQRKMVFDVPGFILSTIGLFLVIFGLLQVPVWGVLEPFHPPFTVWGYSPALFLTFAGIVVLALMLRWEGYRERTTGCALIPRTFLQTPQVRTGLYMTAYIFLAYSAGVFGVVSFVQIVSGLNAIRTGMLIVPFACCMAGCSLGLPLLIKNRDPYRQCRFGLLLGLLGSIVTTYGIHPFGFSTPLVIGGLCLIGASMGTLSANAPFLVTSKLPAHDAQQSGGVQAAARDVGQALGVAIVSMVMLTAITFNMRETVSKNAALASQTREAVAAMTVIPYVSDASFGTLMTGAGAVAADLPQLNQLYQRSRANATRMGMLTMAAITVLFLFGIRRRPDDSIELERLPESRRAQPPSASSGNPV